MIHILVIVIVSDTHTDNLSLEVKPLLVIEIGCETDTHVFTEMEIVINIFVKLK